jgi:hypothetical protein
MERVPQSPAASGGLPGSGRRVTVHGLLVPWDLRRVCQVQELALTAVALSDAIGGGLLEEGLYGEIDAAAYSVYLDEDRVAKGLPLNERAAVLSARLGKVDRRWLAGLRGNALFLGRDERLDDADVPPALLEAARRSGLIVDGSGPAADRRDGRTGVAPGA